MAGPDQIFIEAKILQVTLTDSDVYGINWARLFNYDSGEGSFGVTGLPSPGSGLFFSLLTPNIDVALEALETQNRVRSLSSPKLLALEGQKASVVIGERQGYRVTTTINQVTTESIEFLESGDQLCSTAECDRQRQNRPYAHPTDIVKLQNHRCQTKSRQTDYCWITHLLLLCHVILLRLKLF